MCVSTFLSNGLQEHLTPPRRQTDSAEWGNLMDETIVPRNFAERRQAKSLLDFDSAEVADLGLPAAAVSYTSRGQQVRYGAALAREFNPLGVVENLLTRDAARHAARLDTLDAAREALELESTRSLADIFPLHDGANATNRALLGQITAADRLEAMDRQSNGESEHYLQPTEYYPKEWTG